MSGNNNTLPNYIKAKSAKRLRSLMLQNNARLNMSFIDYKVIHDGKDFYAFYNEPIWQNEELKGN